MANTRRAYVFARLNKMGLPQWPGILRKGLARVAAPQRVSTGIQQRRKTFSNRCSTRQRELTYIGVFSAFAGSSLVLLW